MIKKKLISALIILALLASPASALAEPAADAAEQIGGTLCASDLQNTEYELTEDTVINVEPGTYQIGAIRCNAYELEIRGEAGSELIVEGGLTSEGQVVLEGGSISFRTEDEAGYGLTCGTLTIRAAERLAASGGAAAIQTDEGIELEEEMEILLPEDGVISEDHTTILDAENAPAKEIELRGTEDASADEALQNEGAADPDVQNDPDGARSEPVEQDSEQTQDEPDPDGAQNGQDAPTLQDAQRDPEEQAAQSDPEDPVPAQSSMQNVTKQAMNAAVTSYTYSVQPMLAPFNNLIYVKTNNPDPTSFRLADPSSKYKDASSSDSGVFELLDETYLDVVYEKKVTKRIKGGYIFYDYDVGSDGGELVVQQKSNGKWVNTTKKVSCSAMKPRVQYLIDTYTNSSMSFFEKLDAVQDGLDKLAVYPRPVCDTSKLSAFPYPCLATSPYSELQLNEHYDIYERSEEGLFLRALYPFVLDSLGVPGTMGAVAKRLNSKCTVTGAGSHAYCTVTLNGESKVYGGAGAGDNDPLYTTQINHAFRFDNSASDFAKGLTLDKLQTTYVEYGEVADENIRKAKDLLSGETFFKEMNPGFWLRVATEGWGYGMTYAYVAYGPGGESWTASEAWVDGRYVNEHERIELGVKFSDHPKADIILRNQSYTDRNGKQHKNDIVYQYDSDTDTWRAPYYYNDAWWHSSSMELPAQFILTRAQVNKMKLDQNTNRIPASGKIYDGKSYPGTPFKNNLLTKISLPKSITINVGDSKKVKVTPTPSNATDTYATWTSKNEDIVSFFNYSEIEMFGRTVGSTTVTAKSRDGGYTASCTVNVCFKDVPLTGKYYSDPVYWAVKKGITKGYTDSTGLATTFGPARNCTRAEMVTFLWRHAGKPEPKTKKNPFKDVKSNAYYYKAVLWAVEKGITKGYADKTFKPNATCLREHAVTFLWRYAGKPKASSKKSFKDIKAKDYYRNAVVWAVSKGITKGYANGTFKPKANCLREHIVTFLYRYKK